MELSHKTKIKLLLLGGFIGAYLLRDYLGSTVVPTSFLLYGFIVVTYFTYMGQLGGWRYASPQLIAPNFHASVIFDPYVIPSTKYVVFPIGSYFAPSFMMASEGGEGTLITLKSCVKKISPNYLSMIAVGRFMKRVTNYDIESGEGMKASSNYMCFCPMMAFDLEALAPEITDFLKSAPNKFKPPYFFGYPLNEETANVIFTAEEKAEYIECLKILAGTYADTNRILHTQKELVNNNFKVVAQATDTLGAINRSLNKTDWKQKLFDRDRSKIEREDNM